MAHVRESGRDERCPLCAATSKYIPPETVDIGVGQQPIEADQWICPRHGRWCYNERGELLVEDQDAPPSYELNPPPHFLPYVAQRIDGSTIYVPFRGLTMHEYRRVKIGETLAAKRWERDIVMKEAQALLHREIAISHREWPECKHHGCRAEFDVEDDAEKHVAWAILYCPECGR